jgi:hypothetical protein
VLDRLRVFMHRPLGDDERARLFLVAVAAILLGAAALALIDEPRPAEPAPELRRPVAARPTPEPAPSLAVPSEEGEPQDTASRADVEAAKAAARRFLEGYLPFSYGQASARSLEGAGDELRSRLEAEPPRVPAGERARRPRVLIVQAEGVGAVRAGIVALVADGARRYTVPLELERRRSGWVVTGVGG